MPEHQLTEVLELANSKISKLASLIALLAHDSYTDMRLLDHVNVVSAISDS